MPIMKLPAADAERLLLALAGPGNIAVGRDRHRKIGSRHISSTQLWSVRLHLRRPRWPEKLIGYPNGRIRRTSMNAGWQRSGPVAANRGRNGVGGGCSRA